MSLMSNNRFLSDFYDSVQQRSYPKIIKNPSDLKSLFVGRLRFDTLLSNKIILTDAMLLDGSLFLDINPTILIESIKRSDIELPPVEIRARHYNLEVALMKFVKKERADKLTGFTFSSINNEVEREQAKIELEKTDASQLKSWEDILNIFQRANVDGGNIARIKEGWAKWIEAQNKNLLVIRGWDRLWNFEKNLHGVKQFIPQYQKEEGQQIPEVGKEAANIVYQYRYDRNTMDIKLNELIRQSGPPDKPAIYGAASWYHTRYNRTLAEQHSCDVFESVYPSLESIFRKSSIRAEDFYTSGIPLENDLIVGLGDMPNNEYRNLFWQKKTELKSWWRQGNIDSLKRGLEPFVEKLLNAQRRITETEEINLITTLFIYGATFLILGFPVPGVEKVINYFSDKWESAPIEAYLQRIATIAEERERHGIKD